MNTQGDPAPFGNDVTWDRTGRVLQVAADRSLGSLLERVREEDPDWVVVVRSVPEEADVYHYVFRGNELVDILASECDDLQRSIAQAIDLHQQAPSRLARGGRPVGPAYNESGPAPGRIVDFDSSGRIVAIGERVALALEVFEFAAAADSGPRLDFGTAAEPALTPTPDDDFPDLIVTPAEHKDLLPDWGSDDQEATGPGLGFRPVIRPVYPAIPDDAGALGPLQSGVGAAPRIPAAAAPVRRPRRSLRSDVDAASVTPAAAAPARRRGGPDITSPAPTAVAPEPESKPDIDVMLSAETDAEVDLGAKFRVLFQIELAAGAAPLAVSQPARAQQDVPIVVSLSVQNGAIGTVHGLEITVPPPRHGRPSTGYFTGQGNREGICGLEVTFRQGGSELGAIPLAVEVVAAGAGHEKTSGDAIAAPPDATDADRLTLLVEQRQEGGQVFYEYTLISDALDLPYRRVRSEALLDRGDGPANTPVKFVERIYAHVTRELHSHDDLKALQREARALGASLCQELFDPEVARLLWPLRHRIKQVQIVSWEPYIPWELVRLRDPESGAIDDHFLCEYGLVRRLSGVMPSRELQLQQWRYLGAQFPCGSMPPVDDTLGYFTAASADSLRSKGFTPEAIPATCDAFYNALAQGDFDVLHIACHAESQHQSIEDASLIIGDAQTQGDSEPQRVQVSTITTRAEANLKQRHPLVFLNGCETGRSGPQLTAWGGWPEVFLRQGAGAFVGTAWAVRAKPAARFAQAFYNALLDGRTLAEAASAARAAAKALGDASWLAFKVYGHPGARRAVV